MNNTITKNGNDFKVLSDREKLEKARKQALEDMFEYGFEVAKKLEFPMLKGKKNENTKIST